MSVGEETGYCLQCEKYVQVIFEDELDESGQHILTPYCQICQTQMEKCYNCLHWKPDSKFTPLIQTNGICIPKKNMTPHKIHAMHVICKSFKEI